MVMKGESLRSLSRRIKRISFDYSRRLVVASFRKIPKIPATLSTYDYEKVFTK